MPVTRNGTVDGYPTNERSFGMATLSVVYPRKPGEVRLRILPDEAHAARGGTMGRCGADRRRGALGQGRGRWLRTTIFRDRDDPLRQFGESASGADRRTC